MWQNSSIKNKTGQNDKMECRFEEFERNRTTVHKECNKNVHTEGSRRRRVVRKTPRRRKRKKEKKA